MKLTFARIPWEKPRCTCFQMPQKNLEILKRYSGTNLRSCCLIHGKYSLGIAVIKIRPELEQFRRCQKKRVDIALGSNLVPQFCRWRCMSVFPVPHRSRINPSRSEIICTPILINITTKITLKDLIDTHGLHFVSKSRILKV